MIENHGSETLLAMQPRAVKPLYRRAWESLPERARRGLSRPASWIALSLIVCTLVGYGIHRHRRRAALLSLRQECTRLSAENDWNGLLDASAEWAQLEPQRADPWLYRAEAAEGLKDWAGMVAYLDRVPRSDGRIIATLVRKAVTEFEKLNRPWDSMKTCDELLAIDPRVLIAHKQTIFFYAMTLQRAEMVKRVRRAIRVQRESPESYVFLVGASWLYSGSLYRHNSHWLEADPDNETFQVARSVQIYLAEVKSDLEHAGEFDHILSDEELLRKYPHNLELVAYFLNKCISEGDVERIRELLGAVPAELAQADARFWRARAWYEDSTGDLAAAEKSLRRAFAIDPYWWQVHFQLHDLLRRTGQVEEAARFFEMYRISKALTNEIKTLAQSTENLDDRKFCESMLELAQLVGDEEICVALRERLAKL